MSSSIQQRSPSHSFRFTLESKDKTSFYVGSGLVVNALQSYGNGDYESALKTLVTALKTQRLTLGDTDICVAHTLGNIGSIYLKMGPEWSSYAIEVLEEALGIKLDLKSNPHFQPPKGCKDVILHDTLNNLGSAHAFAGDYIQAMAYYQDALKEITSDASSTSAEDLANALYNIGNIHCLMEEYEDALLALGESLDIVQSTFGEDDIQAAEILEKIGAVHLATRDIDQAMTAFLESLRILKVTLGSDNIDCAPCLFNMARAYEMKGENVKAMDAMAIALEIFQRKGSKVNEGVIDKVRQKMMSIKVEP